MLLAGCTSEEDPSTRIERLSGVESTADVKLGSETQQLNAWLDKEFDDEEMGEEVELPVEDKFTNDLDPAEKK